MQGKGTWRVERSGWCLEKREDLLYGKESQGTISVNIGPRRRFRQAANSAEYRSYCALDFPEYVLATDIGLQFLFGRCRVTKNSDER